MRLAKWNRKTGKQREGWNSVQTNVNWCRWKEVYTRSKALCPDGYLSEMQSGHCARHFHTNAGSLFLRYWSPAALCKSLPTRCPSACWGRSNSEQRLTHGQSRTCTPCAPWDRRVPEFAETTQTTSLDGDWQCAGHVFVEMTSGLNRAQHQSVCTFWRATTIIHILKKMRTL